MAVTTLNALCNCCARADGAKPPNLVSLTTG